MTTAIVAIVLLLVVLLPLGLVAVGLYHAARKLRAPCFLLLLAALILGPYGAFKVYEHRLQLSVVPDALRVTGMSYNKEASWGFGPGGNEAGFRAYRLPDDVAIEIEHKGMAFFETMPPNQDQDSRGWRGQYMQWKATPVAPDDAWKPRQDTGRLDVDDYVHRYACCIEVDARLIEQAEAIVNSPGSYYAHGRIGLIVVNPKSRLVLYLYNG